MAAPPPSPLLRAPQSVHTSPQMTALLPINEELNKAALSLEDKLQTCGDPNFFLELELLKEGTNVRSKCSSVEELTECGAYKFRSAWGMNILARKVIERSLKYAAANEDQEPNSLLTWYEGYQLRVLLALNPPDEDVYDVGYPELGLGGAGEQHCPTLLYHMPRVMQASRIAHRLLCAHVSCALFSEARQLGYGDSRRAAQDAAHERAQHSEVWRR